MSKLAGSKALDRDEKIVKTGDFPALAHSSGMISVLLCDGDVRMVMYGKNYEVNELIESLLNKFDQKTLERNLGE